MVLGPEAYGRTDQYVMAKLKWKTVEELYEDSIVKLAHKTVTNQIPMYYHMTLTENRTPYQIGQNKLADNQPNQLRIVKRQFSYKVRDLYNRLPFKLTQIKHQKRFSKWLDRWKSNKEIKLPDK